MQEIGDILEGKEPEPQAVEPEAVQEEVTQEATETTGEAESSTPEPVEETQAVPEGYVPMQALKDERRKRQDLEAQLSEKTQQPTPDVIDNPEGFTQHVQQLVAASSHETRVVLSQEMMRDRHDDYDTREASFVEMAEKDPTLWARLNQSANPAKFAYDTAVKAEKLSQMENVDEYESKVRAEIETKVREELEQKIKAESEKTSGITPSLAKQSSAGTINGASWDGPTPLGSILK